MEQYGLTLVTPPTAEPLTLDEVKLWLKIEHAAEDTLLDGLIRAARLLAERLYDRQLVTATWRATCDRFEPRAIKLPRGPLRSVTSVQYLDTAGALQTLDPSAYEVDGAREPGTVGPAYGQAWPATRCQAQAVRITYQSGYGGAADVPEPIKAALKFAIAMWCRRRGDGTEEIDPGLLSLPSATHQMLTAYWPGSYP